MKTFHVQEVGGGPDAGSFTVILTEDGVVKGGDHHWLSRDKAEQALAIYSDNPDLHGATSSELGLE